MQFVLCVKHKAMQPNSKSCVNIHMYVHWKKWNSSIILSIVMEKTLTHPPVIVTSALQQPAHLQHTIGVWSQEEDECGNC